MDAGFRIKTVVFFTPEEKMMTVTEAQRRGYGIANTPTRLVLRSPITSPETYTQHVSGLHFYILNQLCVLTCLHYQPVNYWLWNKLCNLTLI